MAASPSGRGKAVQASKTEKNIPRALEPGDVVVILGAGNMGSGIAQAAAQAGFTTRVRDLTDADIQRGRQAVEATLDGGIKRGKSTPEKKAKVLSRLEFTTDLKAALTDARLVVEAVFEEEKVKRPLFEDVVRQVDPTTIVATNTSSLSVTSLFRDLPEPGRFAGLHFFYPAAINKLVEVVGGEGTSPETLESLTRFSYQLRKIPIQVKDAAGFCVNRFFVPFLNESARLQGEGVANIPTIEKAACELLGTSMGPFGLMNVTGIPIAYHSMGSLQRAFGRFYEPAPALKAQFEAKQKWDLTQGVVEEAKLETVRDRLLGSILGITTRLVEEGVATPEETDRGATVGLRWSRGPFAIMNEVGVPAALEAVQKVASTWGDDFPVSAALRDRAASGSPTWPLHSVRLQLEPPLAWVLLDRPESMNALNTALLHELEMALTSAASHPDIRVLLLAGSSNVFAAGADIAEMAGKTVTEAREFTNLGQKVARTLETLPKPVIAVVEGYALGGGLELALSADFILAAEETQLGLPEVSLGIIPGFGGTQRMLRLIGRAKTKMLVESGLVIGAREAYDLGLIARLVPAARLRSEARSLAGTIASRAPFAVKLARTIIDQGMDAPLPAALHLEAQGATSTFSTHDQKEGMAAFLEKRPPKFEGR